MIERWLVLAYLLVCVVVGALATRRVLGSADEYWVAGRRVGTGVNSLAIMAALASGGSLVGVLGLAYSGGIPATLALFAGAVVGFPLATILVAAPLRRLAKFTITDFMVFRYPHGVVRTLVPLIIVVSLTVYMVAQMKAAGITAEALLGVDYGTAITVATVVFVLYVSFGGMVAVTVTDVMQGALLFLLMGITAVVLTVSSGSLFGPLQAATAASPAFGRLPAGGSRYLDVDGDGIPYRTYPGAGRKGAYFVRGSGHNKYGGYTEDADEYQEVVDRLVRKWETAATLVPKPVIQRRKTAEWGIVSVGSCDYAVAEAVEVLARKGIYLSYMRVKAFPFSAAVTEFLHQHKRIFVVEQNRDAQLKSLLTLETDYPKERMESILNYSGLPIDRRCVVEAIEASVARGEAA